MQRCLAQLHHGSTARVRGRRGFAFERGSSPVRDHDPASSPGGYVADAAIETDRMDGIAKLADCLLPRNLVRGDLIVERPGKTKCRIHDGAQLIDPVVDQALVHDRGGEPDRGDHRQRRQSRQDGKLGAEPEVAENMHGDTVASVAMPGMLATLN
jgi:hypothetical protein